MAEAAYSGDDSTMNALNRIMNRVSNNPKTIEYASELYKRPSHSNHKRFVEFVNSLIIPQLYRLRGLDYNQRDPVYRIIFPSLGDNLRVSVLHYFAVNAQTQEYFVSDETQEYNSWISGDSDISSTATGSMTGGAMVTGESVTLPGLDITVSGQLLVEYPIAIKELIEKLTGFFVNPFRRLATSIVNSQIYISSITPDNMTDGSLVVAAGRYFSNVWTCGFIITPSDPEDFGFSSDYGGGTLGDSVNTTTVPVLVPTFPIPTLEVADISEYTQATFAAPGFSGSGNIGVQIFGSIWGFTVSDEDYSVGFTTKPAPAFYE
jgi:hypothetical protein